MTAINQVGARTTLWFDTRELSTQNPPKMWYSTAPGGEFFAMMASAAEFNLAGGSAS
jgi:hypothetical protein